MKKFSFRLEKLLRLKERMEALKRGEYSSALQRVRDRERALESLEDERRRCSASEQEHLLAASLDVTRLLTYSRYFHHLRGEALMTTEIKRALEKKAEDKRQELVESSREKKALEQYREKLQLRHMQEMDSLERQELDELSSMRYIRAKISPAD